MPVSDLAIYIHWPFCRAKCPYCDFNSHVVGTVDHAAWRAAYGRELASYAARLPNRRISSVFFGGGTPSLMEPATVDYVLNEIASLWVMSPDVEITLEANPTSSEADKFASFRTAGVNRLSLGVQALNDQDLKFLGREHNSVGARRAMEWARSTFPRFSFDLIYARRGQTAAMWERELREALTLAGDHLSLYQLTIEPATHFYTLSQRGDILTAADDESAAMYEQTQEIMAATGLPAYEISNHARTGQESRHNLTYWHYQDYIGIGPGAHGRFVEGDGVRRATDNHRTPNVWMQQTLDKEHGLRQDDRLDSDAAMREALMMGLRLTEGISDAAWTKISDVPMADFVGTEKIKKLVAEGYISATPDRVRATATGLQRLNAILKYLLT